MENWEICAKSIKAERKRGLSMILTVTMKENIVRCKIYGMHVWNRQSTYVHGRKENSVNDSRCYRKEKARSWIPIKWSEREFSILFSDKMRIETPTNKGGTMPKKDTGGRFQSAANRTNSATKLRWYEHQTSSGVYFFYYFICLPQGMIDDAKPSHIRNSIELFS